MSGTKFLIMQIVIFVSFIILLVLLYFITDTSAPVKVSAGVYQFMGICAYIMSFVMLLNTGIMSMAYYSASQGM